MLFVFFSIFMFIFHPIVVEIVMSNMRNTSMHVQILVEHEERLVFVVRGPFATPWGYKRRGLCDVNFIQKKKTLNTCG